jgi:hypothetical protein
MTKEELEKIFPDDISNANTLTSIYEVVDEAHVLEYCRIANFHFNFLYQNESKHGFYLVDWRVNFTNLESFINNSNLNEFTNNLEIKQFIQSYNISAEILYKRLGLEF